MFSYSFGDRQMPELVRGEGDHILACKRYPVAKLKDLIPVRYIEDLEHNQQIASCCRHPENHDIEAWYSSEAWMNGLDRDGSPLPRGMGRVPDIYIFHCTCGRKHRRFCVGGNNPLTGEEDIRPFWDVR